MIRKALTATTLLLGLSGCVGPKVLGKKISANVVCPNADTKKCVQTDGGNTPLYVEKPQRLLGLEGPDSPRYWDILGHNFSRAGDLYSGVCGGDQFNNPFKAFAAAKNIDPLIEPPTERKFKFSRKASTRWTVSDTGADATAILTAAGVPATSGAIDVKAQVEGALDRLKTSRLDMTGQYVYVAVDRRIVTSLSSPNVAPELRDCATFLQADPTRSVITTLTGVLIETATDGGTLKSNLTATLNAKLATALSQADLARLNVEFERKVDTIYSGEFKPTFQLLSVGHYSVRNGLAATYIGSANEEFALLR